MKKTFVILLKTFSKYTNILIKYLIKSSKLTILLDLYKYLKYIATFLRRWSFYKLFFLIIRIFSGINIIIALILL
jgi:hypothetical protein